MKHKREEKGSNLSHRSETHFASIQSNDQRIFNLKSIVCSIWIKTCASNIHQAFVQVDKSMIVGATLDLYFEKKIVLFYIIW